jgi:hypothetical protein
MDQGNSVERERLAAVAREVAKQKEASANNPLP